MGEISGPNQEIPDIHPFEATELSTGWSFKQTDDSAKDPWLPVKKIPSTVHQDLIDNERLVSAFVHGKLIADRPKD